MSFYYVFCSFPISDVFPCFPCLVLAYILNLLGHCKDNEFRNRYFCWPKEKASLVFFHASRRHEQHGTNLPATSYYTFLWFRIYILMEQSKVFINHRTIYPLFSFLASTFYSQPQLYHYSPSFVALPLPGCLT